MTNKNINKKFTFAISSKTFITVILLIGLLASPLTANNLSSIDIIYAEEEQQQKKEKKGKSSNKEKIEMTSDKKYDDVNDTSFLDKW